MADGQNAEVVVGKLSTGKKILAYNIPGTSLVGLKFSSGGQIPVALRGGYTSLRYAEKAAQRYLELKDGQSSAA